MFVFGKWLVCPPLKWVTSLILSLLLEKVGNCEFDHGYDICDSPLKNISRDWIVLSFTSSKSAKSVKSVKSAKFALLSLSYLTVAGSCDKACDNCDIISGRGGVPVLVVIGVLLIRGNLDWPESDNGENDGANAVECKFLKLVN